MQDGGLGPAREEKRSLLIPEHKIEEVLERCDIVALISRHVELKKSGRSYKGRCPFHEEKTASFHVTPEMRRFKCFGCQVGGDAIAFVQRYFGKTFVDAVKDLARETGVELQAFEDPIFKERRQLREVTEKAAEHFKARFWDPDTGRVARAYVEGRGIHLDTARVFGLGWAPLAWSDLTDPLTKAGVLEWAISAGLVQKRAQGDGYYDTFRGRLIIPIRSAEGRTIAFGGRLLEGEGGPKYLNSRESALYSKSDVLYGLDQAREEIRRRKSAVLVEGYFDCIALHQAGIPHAVALCSTALTSGHLSTLARADAKELILLLDGDEAGRKAVERLAGPLLAAGTASKVALLPEGEDPDTFVRKAGEAASVALLNAARPLTEHLFLAVLPAGRIASFEDKMKGLERLKPIAAQLPVGLMRSAFFSAMGNHFGLPAAELEGALRSKAPHFRPAPKEAAGQKKPALAQPSAPVREQVHPPDSLEATFVACVLRDSRLAAEDSFDACGQLLHPGLRSLAAAAISSHPEDAISEASTAVRDAVKTALEQLPADEELLSHTFAAVGRKLKLRRIDEQLSYIAHIAGQTQGVNDLSEETRKLQGERMDRLALRRRVLQESSPIPPGTNPQG